MSRFYFLGQRIWVNALGSTDRVSDWLTWSTNLRPPIKQEIIGLFGDFSRSIGVVQAAGGAADEAAHVYDSGAGALVGG